MSATQTQLTPIMTKTFRNPAAGSTRPASTSALNQIETEDSAQDINSPMDCIDAIEQEASAIEFYTHISGDDDFPAPVTRYESYVVDPLLSQEQVEIAWRGMKIINANGVEKYAPFYVFCCIKGQALSYEVKFLSGSNWIGNSVVFSAPIKSEVRTLEHIPESLYVCEAYLNSQIMGVEDEIRHFLIDQMSEVYVKSESGDFSECFDLINSLYEESTEQRALFQDLPVNLDYLDHVAKFGRYMVSNKWVDSGIDGTEKLTPNLDAVGSLTDVSVGAAQTFNNNCVITVSDAELTESGVAVKFQSKNSLPHDLPSAALQAIDYLCVKRPDDVDIVTGLVLGSVGWLDWEECAADLGSLYYDAAELYQKQTGLEPKGVIAEDDFWGHSDKG